jgi:hypothetical protein
MGTATACGAGERGGDGVGDVGSTTAATVTARLLLRVGSEEGMVGCVRDSLGGCGGSTTVRVGAGVRTATEKV